MNVNYLVKKNLQFNVYNTYLEIFMKKHIKKIVFLLTLSILVID